MREPLRRPLGDTHNFGRAVSLEGDRVHKPRTLAWEALLLSATSPLRRTLADLAEQRGLGRAAFDFLHDLRFEHDAKKRAGSVERVRLAPLGELDASGRRSLAAIFGRALALFSWLGLADLHWENLVVGRNARGQIIFAPLDVEMILDDLSLPTQTKLIPEADPDYAAVCQHACGARRLLPFLGKPIGADDLVAMASAYLTTLELLDEHARAIAGVFAKLSYLATAPIRVCLRGTDEYVHAAIHGERELTGPPLLDAEREQMGRGDIPYFFRLYGRRGIHYYADASLRETRTLPLRGDVPQLARLLSVARDLRSPNRTKLREEGLFTVVGAFDHPGITGTHASGALSIGFRKRALVLALPDGEELEAARDLAPFVSSVYSPCDCGEVRAVFVPEKTICKAEARRS